MNGTIDSSALLGHSMTRKKEDQRTKGFVYMVGSVAALGGLIFGFDVAGSGGTFVMQGFKEHFGWECPADAVDCTPTSQSQINLEQSMVAGLFAVGAALGALFAPYLFNNYGRKPTMCWGALIFTVGASLQAAAVNMTMLLVPRLLSGAGIGMLSMCSPVYIEELAPEHVRGQLGTLWQVAITVGILLVASVNIFLTDISYGWRISYGGNVLFSVVLIVFLFFMPESPHFLVAQGRNDEARKVLSRVRFDDQIQWEVEELEMEALQAKEEGEATWVDLFDNSNNKMRSRVITGMLLQTFQQLSGINALMVFIPIIMEPSLGSKGGLVAGWVLNVINCVSTVVTLYTIDKFGRAKLLFLGGLLCGVAQLTNSILAASDDGSGSKALAYGVVVVCAFFQFGFAVTWGPVVWVVCAEMFPLRVRGKATSMTTFANWFWAAVVQFLFPFANAASQTACFAFFGVIMLIAAAFVYLFLAETGNKTAPEINQEFMTHRATVPRKKWA